MCTTAYQMSMGLVLCASPLRGWPEIASTSRLLLAPTRVSRTSARRRDGQRHLPCVDTTYFVLLLTLLILPHRIFGTRRVALRRGVRSAPGRSRSRPTAGDLPLSR